SAIVRSARPDSPTLLWLCSSVFVPAAFPAMTAITTKASQPQIASLRCWALQTPARAATPRGVIPNSCLWFSGRDADMRPPVVGGDHDPIDAQQGPASGGTTEFA